MMTVVNSVFSWFIKRRMDQIEAFTRHPVDTQQAVLHSLLQSAASTQFGRDHNFREIRNYEQFRKSTPVFSYEKFKPYIDQVLEGKQNVIWPSKIKWFAKSSGTTSDRSKFIPVSPESLDDCHYKAGKDMYCLYYHMRPQANLVRGKSLVLGGSHEINKLNEESSYGDLSAVLVQNLPFWAELKRSPDLETALMDDWEAKIDRMARSTLDEDITSILGVPTWTVVLINKLFEMTGKDNLADIWPNLELYVHGGVSFTPYRGLFNKLIRKDDMFYMETYNASEGFFAIQDRVNSEELLLMLDYGIFYEFVPAGMDIDNPLNAVSLDQVETGKNYAILITTNAGLWRYRIGDTVRFTSLDPYRIKLTGRTKHFINAFGEEVIIENAETALSAACKATRATVNDYTAAPIYFSGKNKGGHEWLIEFENEPNDLHLFSRILDDTLQEINTDYQAKRFKDMALNPPKLRILAPETFYRWMKKRGKLGGQNKVPRLSNNRKYIDDILNFVQEEGLEQIRTGEI